MSFIPFQRVITRLEAFYGEPEPPDVTDPWDMIVGENIAYLADDARRRAAMTMLRDQVGTNPEETLAAPPARVRRGGFELFGHLPTGARGNRGGDRQGVPLA